MLFFNRSLPSGNHSVFAFVCSSRRRQTDRFDIPTESDPLIECCDNQIALIRLLVVVELGMKLKVHYVVLLSLVFMQMVHSEYPMRFIVDFRAVADVRRAEGRNFQLD